jgi:DnaJ domain
MSTHDLLIIVGCGVLGFVLVHFFIRKPPAAPQRPSAPPRAANPLPEPPPPGTPHWTHVLELPQDASIEQVRDAYRRLISQYHPDKVASLGRELQELAEAKSKEIAIAYQAAVIERGGVR